MAFSIEIKKCNAQTRSVLCGHFADYDFVDANNNNTTVARRSPAEKQKNNNNNNSKKFNCRAEV